jgi:uncharacterized protein YqgC (DUF456 family)
MGLRRILGAIRREWIGREAWHESFRRSIVQILGFLPNAIVALILKATLDASQTRPFVTCSCCQQSLPVV